MKTFRLYPLPGVARKQQHISKYSDAELAAQIQRVLEAFLFLSAFAIENATDDELSQMMHKIELIQKEIHLRYLVAIAKLKRRTLRGNK